jgi:hypothetical protein
MSVAERPIPDGRCVPPPEFVTLKDGREVRLADASPSEQMEWLVEQQKAKRRNPPLPEPVKWTPAQEAQAQKDAEERWRQETAPQVFSAADLFASPAAVWHTMPNGARVAVHPLSVEEAIRLNAKAAEDFRKLPAGLSEEERNLHAHFRPMAWQVALCCREGLDPTSPRVFKPEHVEVLMRNPGWLETVQAIVVKSNQAGGEEKALKEMLRGFFGATEAYLRTLLSQWNTASPETLRESLEGFAACVSRMRSGGLTESDVEAVRSL